MTVFADISPDDPNKIKITGEYRFNTVIRMLPGVRFKGGNDWEMPLTWQGCLSLRGTFKENLEIGPSLLEWATDRRINYINPLLELRQALDAPGYPDLYPFQRAGVAFLAKAERAFLCDGLGAGKTRQALSTIRYLYETGQNPFPVFIAAPNSTKISWAREVDEVWPGLRTTIVSGSAAQRRKQFDAFRGAEVCPIHQPDLVVKKKGKKTPNECLCAGHILIMNWESIRSHSRLAPYGSIGLKRCTECGGADEEITTNKCQVHIRELNEIEFNTVIGDEIHRIKDAKTQQARAFKAATGDARFRYGLSGTPIASSPDDLWSPLNWMLPQAYPSSSKYKERFLNISLNAWGAETVMGIYPHMEEEFFAGLDPHMRRMPKEIVLPFLPPVLRERRDVEMSPKQAKAYKQMKEQMVAELDGGLAITTSPLTQMQRLLQFSSAFGTIEWREVLDQDTQQMVKKPFVILSDPSCKLDAFMDDIEDFGDESVVVFAASKQLINLLSKRLDKAKIAHGLITGDQDTEERQQHMDNFQAGRTKFILCTIQAGGTGITLTKGSIAVFLQRSWSMIDNEQAEGRVHRIGSQQHDVIRIIDYVTLNSSEEAVFEAIDAKGDQLQRILRDKDLLRKVLEENRLDEEEDKTDDTGEDPEEREDSGGD